jgi:hypothetical protein
MDMVTARASKLPLVVRNRKKFSLQVAHWKKEQPAPQRRISWHQRTECASDYAIRQFLRQYRELFSD